MRERRYLRRGIVYLAGLVILSFGLMLSTKTGLGASAVTSLPFAISKAFHLSMTAAVFGNYVLMVGLQALIKRRDFSWRDLLQIPLCGVNSVLMGWSGELWTFQPEILWQKVLLLLGALVLVGVGAAVTVKMEVAPQPPEGLAQTVSDALGRNLGFGKNLVDMTCVGAAALTDLLFGGGKLSSVGIGTVLAMILVGRVIFLLDRTCIGALRRFAGLDGGSGEEEEDAPCFRREETE